MTTPDLHENSLRIEFSASNDDVLNSLFGERQPPWGFKNQPFPGVLVVNKTESQFGLMDLQPLTDLVLNYADDVTINLLAAWIYDIIKGKVENLRINGKSCAIEKPSIEKALAEERDEKPKA